MGCGGSSATQTADSTKKDAPVAASSGSVRDNAKPIVIYNKRTLPEGGEQAFTEKYVAAADYLFDKVPGFKMIISTPSEVPNVWYDIQIFND